MKRALQMTWLKISPDTARKLCESMSKRIRQVIKRLNFAGRYGCFYVLEKNTRNKRMKNN